MTTNETPTIKITETLDIISPVMIKRRGLTLRKNVTALGEVQFIGYATDKATEWLKANFNVIRESDNGHWS